MALQLGYMNTVVQVNRFIKAHPVYSKIRTANLNFYPYSGVRDASCLLGVTMMYADCICFVHGLNGQIPQTSVVVGEIFSPMVPAAMCMSTDNARTELVEIIQDSQAHIVNIADLTPENYVLFKATNLYHDHYENINMPATYPFNEAFYTNLTYQQAVCTLAFAANFSNASPDIAAISYYTHAYVAAAKRGVISDAFIEKINTSLRAELNVVVVISKDAISTIYNSYMSGINGTNAQQVFTELAALIPQHALRLSLTLTQTSGAGLTCYVLIGRAIRKYPDFPWARVDRLTAGELRAWRAAVVTVGDNMYYGFNRDLGAAKSTLYKSVAYVAGELLRLINGETSINNYAGLGQNVKEKARLKQLIQNYIAFRNEQEEDVLEDHEIELQQQIGVVAAAHDIFA